jgi:hypothetical protein
MGWERQAPEGVAEPKLIVLSRWMLAAGVALLTCVLLFLLHTSARVPQVQDLNIWVFAGSPLLIWFLVFAARAYVFGSALSHHRFLEEEAQSAQLAWQDWAQRYLAVHACCVVLPDQVSAGVLTQGVLNLAPRTGQARRIAALPSKGDRAQAGLQLLICALASAVHALPKEQQLRVTLLSDVDPDQYEALREVLLQIWATATHQTPPAVVNLTAELSCQWVDETLKTASAAFDLILVLQVNGKAAYSDGLAALLLCPDNLSFAWELPVVGKLLRPMPLDSTALKSELRLFLQTQTSACLATGLLADGAQWQPFIGQFNAIGCAHGAALKLEQQWIQETWCGLPGPFGHWLVAALGVEMARHQQGSLLTLTQEQSRQWISSVTNRDIT